MSALRLVMITSRYWPLVGETELFLIRLADGLRRHRVDLSVITARWDTRWPERAVLREIPFQRVGPPPRNAFQAMRYERSVQRELRERAGRTDLAYVANLRYDASAAVEGCKPLGIPVVLRAQRADHAWLHETSAGRRARKTLQQAFAVVASSYGLASELQEMGIEQARIRYIPNGVASPPPRCPERQSEARAALAAANRDLTVAEFTPVAVCAGPFCPERGLMPLIEAWPRVAARWPGARLWLIGDGPERDTMYERVTDLGLRHLVLMPGSFDDVDELFTAADLFIEPVEGTDGGEYLLRAMAAGLPVVAGDGRLHRELLAEGTQGRLVPPGDPSALATAVLAVWDLPLMGSSMGANGRRHVTCAFPDQLAVEAHLHVFEQAVAEFRQEGR